MEKFCPYCGGRIAENRCTNCGASVSPEDQVDKEAAPNFEPFSAKNSSTGGCPWENYKTIGFFPAIIENIKQVLFSSSSFFSRMPRSGGFGMPLFYAVIVGSIGAIVAQIWALLAKALSITPLAMLGMADQLSNTGGELTAGIAGFFIYLVFAPIAIAAASFLQAGLYHLMLIILGGAEENFETTYRVVAYSMSSSLANVIPIIGSIVSSIWGMVIIINGLREAHGIQNKTAVMAVLLPLIVCCVCGVAFAILFGGALLSLIGAASFGG